MEAEGVDGPWPVSHRLRPFLSTQDQTLHPRGGRPSTEEARTRAHAVDQWAIGLNRHLSSVENADILEGQGRNIDLDELYRLMRGAHVQAQGMIDTVRDPLLVLDEQLKVVTANLAFYDAFRVEVHAEFGEIGPRTILVTARRLVRPDTSGRVLLLTLVDATERRKKEEQSAVLMGELQHRMKNLLGLVQALVRQTGIQNRSAEDYRDALVGRLEALSRSLDLSMSGKAAPLGELIANTLEPYDQPAAAVEVEGGPEIALTSAQALSVGMILHELSTNAAKHGALSSPEGRIRISWSIEPDGQGTKRVELRWQEAGGPVVSPPEVPGFGTRLIRFAAAQDLGGDAELSYAPEGLLAEVRFPLPQET